MIVVSFQQLDIQGFGAAGAKSVHAMGCIFSREAANQGDIRDTIQAREIDKRIAQQSTAEKKVQKLLLLGAGESGKSTIFKQIKVLFQTGFDDSEKKNYTSVVHANAYQSIKILLDGLQEFSESEQEKYTLLPENKAIGEKLKEIGNRTQQPPLTEELAQQIEALWKDPAIQASYLRANELQLPDCASHFLNDIHRLAQPDYVPSKEDVLYARVRTMGIVETEFSPVGETKKRGELYRLFDVGGQRNERRKWIHLFDGVTAVIFCAALSEYDQTLFEDESSNRMIETKELFEWVLKEPTFEKTSFLLFLNKFDIFEQKINKVPLNTCEWFKDYKPLTSGQAEVENAYGYVKTKFEELYNESTPPDQRLDRVFKVYKTTALDENLIKRTFRLVDEVLVRQRLMDAKML